MLMGLRKLEQGKADEVFGRYRYSGGFMKASDGPIVVEQTLNADVETVWKSITEIDRMRQWYFDNIPSFKPQVGFETQFMVSSHGRDFPHRWKVTEVVPNKKIAYDWSFENYAGDSFVEFELFEQGSSTRLRLTCTVREDFPEDIPEFQGESCAAGWEYFIQKSLREYLDGA